MPRRKSSPLSIRLDESDAAKLGARATELGVSSGTLARDIISVGLQIEMHLEGLRHEFQNQQFTFALLRSELERLNDNLHDALEALLFAKTGNREIAKEMADEVVKPFHEEE